MHNHYHVAYILQVQSAVVQNSVLVQNSVFANNIYSRASSQGHPSHIPTSNDADDNRAGSAAHAQSDAAVNRTSSWAFAPGSTPPAEGGPALTPHPRESQAPEQSLAPLAEALWHDMVDALLEAVYEAPASALKVRG